MFEKFLESMGVIDNDKIKSPQDFQKKYSGFTFMNGLYRLHKFDEIDKWTKIVERAFPGIKGDIEVFAFDWMGRQFAISKSTKQVLMIEPGTGEVFEIPADFRNFHDTEIADYSEDALSADFFAEWYASEFGQDIPYNQCLGYKEPLFTEGEDSMENLELQDLTSYWQRMTDLMKKEFL